jgi:hypothetical protein
MVTTYEFTETDAEATRMTLRNAGIPGDSAKIAARGTERAMRSANKKDLQQLKAVLASSRGGVIVWSPMGLRSLGGSRATRQGCLEASRAGQDLRRGFR